MSLNNVCLVGRVASEIEGRVTSTGKNVSTFRIAVTKRIKPTDGSPDADFFNVCAWNNQADYCDNYLLKGRLVAVEGRLQSRRYQASDGSQREIVEIVASSVNGLDRPREEAPAPNSEGHYANPGDTEYDPFAEEA